MFILKLLLVVSNIVSANASSAFNINEAKQRCLGHSDDSPHVYMSDFKWGYTLESMAAKFD